MWAHRSQNPIGQTDKMFLRTQTDWTVFKFTTWIYLQTCSNSVPYNPKIHIPFKHTQDKPGPHTRAQRKQGSANKRILILQTTLFWTKMQPQLYTFGNLEKTKQNNSCMVQCINPKENCKTSRIKDNQNTNEKAALFFFLHVLMT